MTSIKTTFSLTVGALLLVMAGGCATPQTATEKDFGNSVRAMNRAQTMDPVAAVAPDPNAPDRTDGPRLESVLEAYRGDVTESGANVRQPISINVD